MGCTSVIGAFAFLLLSCAAANRQAHLRDQSEKDGFMDDPLIGIEGDLKITTLEPGKVEGEFHATNDDGRGVYFLSEVKEDSRFLLITTLEGEQLYRAVSPRNNDILVSLMGNDFLLNNYENAEGRAILQGRMVPAGSVAAIERTLDEPEGIEERLFSAEDEAYSLSVMQRSYKKLHRRFEIACFVHATVKLGRENGVLGSEYPAAMSLYVMAMRLSKHEGAASGAISLKNAVQQSCSAPKLYCSNSNSCCKKCPLGRICLGMCGPGCTCWSWACGDCCYHQGCYDHDLCCQTYLSWNCLGVWKFQCNSYSCK